MKPVSSLLMGALVCGTAIAASTVASVAADKIDFSRYFKSSTSLAAVSSAVSILEPCDTPIAFSEDVDKESVTLTAVCKSSDGESISVKLSFQRDESGHLFPDSFDYGN